ncbi:MAG: response regulator [Deltaproteobacteria bacterium]|nr:response regulator [Deltaproteobacteria bacterium]
MPASILKGKSILAVDDEEDILEILAEELEDYKVDYDSASSFEEALDKLASYRYDLVILDIMGVRGFDLLQTAVSRKMPVVMLTAHALSPEALKKSIELGARAYLPKDQIVKMIPFLEDLLMLSYQSTWKSALSRLGGVFGAQFGQEWRKTEKEFWEKFERDLEITESTIIET